MSAPPTAESSSPPPPLLFTSVDDLRDSLAAHGLRINPCSRVVPSDAVRSGWYSGSLACAGPLVAPGSDDGMTDDDDDGDGDEACSDGASGGLCSDMEGLDPYELEDYLELLKGGGLGLPEGGDVRGCHGADDVDSNTNTDATNTHGDNAAAAADAAAAAAAAAHVGRSEGVSDTGVAIIELDVDPDLISDVSDDIATESRRGSTGAATEQEQAFPPSPSVSPGLPEPVLTNGTNGAGASVSASDDPSPPGPTESPLPPSPTPHPVADDVASTASSATPSVTSGTPSVMEIDEPAGEDDDEGEDEVVGDVVMEVEHESAAQQQTQHATTASNAQRHYIELDATPPSPPSPSNSLSPSLSPALTPSSTESSSDSIVALFAFPSQPLEEPVPVPTAAAAVAGAAAPAAAPVVVVGPVVVASNASSHRAKGCAQIDNARGRASRTDEAMSGPPPAPSAPPPPPPPASAAATPAAGGAVRGGGSVLPDGAPPAKKFRPLLYLDVHHLSDHWMPTKEHRRPPGSAAPAPPAVPAPTPVSVPDVFVVRQAERARRVELYMLNMRRKTPRNYGAFVKQVGTFPVGWPTAGSAAARRMCAQFVTVIWKGAGNVLDEQSPVLIAHAIRQRFSSKVERSLADRSRYGELCTRQAADLVDANVLTACATWTHALIAAPAPSLVCLLRDTILMLLKAASPVASSLLEAGGPGATKLVGTLPQALMRVVTEREGDPPLVALAGDCLRVMDSWVAGLRAARQAEADARIEALRAAEAEEAAKVAAAEAAAAAAAEMQKAAAQYRAAAAAATGSEAPAALQSQIVLTAEDVERIQQEPDYPSLAPSKEAGLPAGILKAGGSPSADASEESPEPPRVKKALRFHPEVPEQRGPHVPYTSVFKRRRYAAALEAEAAAQAAAARFGEDAGGYYEPEALSDEDLFVVPSAEATATAALYADVDVDAVPDFVTPTIDYQTVDYSPDTSPEMDADASAADTHADPVAVAAAAAHKLVEPAAGGAEAVPVSRPQHPLASSEAEAEADAAAAAAAAIAAAAATRGYAPPEVIVIGEEDEDDGPSPAEALQLPEDHEGLVMKHVETTRLPIPAKATAPDWTLRCTPFWNAHLPFASKDYGTWSMECESAEE